MTLIESDFPLTNVVDYNTIVVFGGTGTIGSIFTDVLQKKYPYSNIYLITNNEFEIWEGNYTYKDKNNIRVLFGDIRDRDEIRKLFINLYPDLIINCAALKHVDICEQNIMNAIKTNILGLENLLYLSNEYQVQQFIQISTDKAVQPINTMGATKLIGEKLCAEWNKVMDAVSIIRLGNVVDSRGSLLQCLRKQLEKKNVLYYTDKRMKRFIITIEKLKEFLNDIIDKILPGYLYIPKMNEVSIFEYIKDFVWNNYKEWQLIKYKKIGSRPGEKLTEKLFHEYEEIEDYNDYYKIKMG